MKRSQYALLVLALVMLGGSVALFIRSPANTNLTDETGRTKGAETTAPSEIPATLTITNGADMKPYLATVAEGTTALALLETVADKNGITIEKKEYEGLGTMVQGINGVQGDSAGFWAFRVNDAEASVGASSYTVQANDRIEFRFEKL